MPSPCGVERRLTGAARRGLLGRMPEIVRIAAFNLLLLCAILYALARGGAPERLAAIVIAAGVGLTILFAGAWEHRFAHVEYGILLADALVLAGLLAIALRAERFWPLWMSGAQLLMVVLHLPILLNPDVKAQAYHHLQAGLSWLIVGMLIVATWRHRQRIRHAGTDRSWSASSHPSKARALRTSPIAWWRHMARLVRR